MSRSGFVKLKLEVVNPSLKWLKENWDIDQDEEITYMDGDRSLHIDMYFRDTEDNLHRHSIHLLDEEIVSRQGANLYLNSTGDSQWAERESQLWSNFIAWEKILSWSSGAKVEQKWFAGARPHEKEVIADKEFRKAIKGEPDLLDYVKNFYNHSPYDLEVNILPNLDNLFKGKGKYLKNLITDEYSVTGFLYSDGVKEKLYKKFLPKSFMVHVNQGMKYGTLDKSLKKQYEEFQKNVEHDLNGMDYELQKYGPLSYIKPVITPTNTEY